MSTGTRREARERALELLYEAECKGLAPADVLPQLAVAPDPFAVELVLGVGQRLTDVDALIDRLARGWTLDRMPWVDRNVLRVGAFELLATDVPVGAVISEAVELAKRYSGVEAGRFVNGLLAAIAREVRPDAPPAPAPDEEIDVGGAADLAGADEDGYTIECTLCGWTSGSVATRHAAYQGYEAHFDADHAGDRADR